MEPGDLVFCHSKGVIGKAIRLGEWLRFRRGSHYNHVAILDQPVSGTTDDWWVIQAEARGVSETGKLSDIAPGGSYTVVPLPKGVDSLQVLDFASAQVGRPYGFVTIASIVVSLLLPKFINIMLPDTWICSAVAAESLRAGGWLHNWADVYQVTPAQLWDALVPQEHLS